MSYTSNFDTVLKQLDSAIDAARPPADAALIALRARIVAADTRIGSVKDRGRQAGYTLAQQSLALESAFAEGSVAASPDSLVELARQLAEGWDELAASAGPAQAVLPGQAPDTDHASAPRGFVAGWPQEAPPNQPAQPAPDRREVPANVPPQQ